MLKRFKTRTAKNTIWVASGNILNSTLGFISLAIIARSISTSEYGQFALASSILFMVAELSDLGINAGLIRFASKYIHENNFVKAYAAFTSALKLRLIISFVIIIVGVSLSQVVANSFFHNPEMGILIMVSTIGATIIVLQTYYSAVFQSFQKFNFHLLSNLVNGISKLVLIILLSTLGILSPLNSLFAFIGASLLSLLVSIIISKRNFSLRWITDREVSKEISTFSRWIAVSSLFSVMHGRVEMFMITSLIGTASAALYATALQFAGIYLLFSGALSMVLTPKLTAFTPAELWIFMKKSHIYYAGLTILALIISLAGHIAIPLFFGSAYKDALPTFYLMMFALYLIGCSGIPSSVLNALNKPAVFSITAFIQLLVLIGSNLFLIPRFGIIGAGYSYVLIEIIWLTTSTSLSLYYLHKEL